MPLKQRAREHATLRDRSSDKLGRRSRSSGCIAVVVVLLFAHLGRWWCEEAPDGGDFLCFGRELSPRARPDRRPDLRGGSCCAAGLRSLRFHFADFASRAWRVLSEIRGEIEVWGGGSACGFGLFNSAFWSVLVAPARIRGAFTARFFRGLGIFVEFALTTGDGIWRSWWRLSHRWRHELTSRRRRTPIALPRGAIPSQAQRQRRASATRRCAPCCQPALRPALRAVPRAARGGRAHLPPPRARTCPVASPVTPAETLLRPPTEAVTSGATGFFWVVVASELKKGKWWRGKEGGGCAEVTFFRFTSA